MRTTRKTILAMAGASVLAITNAQAQNEVRSEQSPDELRGDWVIGKTVRSMDDEVIGTITDILIDESDGRVTSAVIDVGGFLGFGAKPIAIEWEAFEMAYDASIVRLDLTREQAEEASEFSFRDQDMPPPPEPPVNTGTGMGTGSGTGAGGG